MGLTPTADENSIKVDGKGSATITDMMVELIPNPDKYEHVYPESEDDAVAEESDDDQSESDPEPDATKALAEEKTRNDDSMMEANEEKKAAASRLGMLESYGRSFENDRPSDLQGCIAAYRIERRNAFQVYKESEDKIKSFEKERVKILKRQAKDSKINLKEKEKASKQRLKKFEQKQKLLQEKLAAKHRLKEERVQFWPRKVYKITLSLDTNSELTPASSRRESIDSLAKPTLESSSESCQISLSVSYITNSAYWSPRYDLSLDTVTGSALIVYRAEYCNTTSETWKDAQVILSTSQTTFQGLEPIPTMLPWHIRLGKALFGGGDGTSGALMSPYETENRRGGPMNVNIKFIEPRHKLFGLNGVSLAPQQVAFKGQHQAMQNVQRQQQMQQQYAQQQQLQVLPAPSNIFGSTNPTTKPQTTSGSLFAPHSASGGGLFGNNNATTQGASGGGLFGNINATTQGASGGGLFGSNTATTQGSSIFSNIRANTQGASSSPFGSTDTSTNAASSNSGNFGAGNATSGGNHALQDYQMQMMLLEQQNKKRMLMARQEQDTLSGAGGNFDEVYAETIVPELPTLSTLESEWNESGYVHFRGAGF